MELWNLWTQGLDASLRVLCTHWGFSEAAGVILLTLIARALLMPISLVSALRMQRNKVALERIKPRIEELRKIYKNDGARLAKHTMALYRKHGIKFMDRLTFANIGSQTTFGIGMYQVLKRATFNSPFMWIPNIAKPDFLLTILVGVLMATAFALTPGTSLDSSNLLVFALPILVSVVAIYALPAALGLYWATSNAATIGQTLLLRAVLSKHPEPKPS